MKQNNSWSNTIVSYNIYSINKTDRKNKLTTKKHTYKTETNEDKTKVATKVVTTTPTSLTRLTAPCSKLSYKLITLITIRFVDFPTIRDHLDIHETKAKNMKRKLSVQLRCYIATTHIGSWRIYTSWYRVKLTHL